MKIMRFIVGWFFAATAVSWLAAQENSAFQSVAVRRLEGDLGKARQEMERLVGSRRVLAAQYDSMIVDVIDLKQRKDLGFFEKIRLKNLLKESEDLAQQLVSMDRVVAGKRAEHQSRIDQLLVLMDGEIRDALYELEHPSEIKAKAHTRQLEMRLQSMMFEKLEFQSIWTDPLVLNLQTVRVSRDDDAETISQKADFLKDQEDKLVLYGTNLQERINKMTSEIEIRDEAMQFIDDIQLFNKNREIRLEPKVDRSDGAVGTESDGDQASGISGSGDLLGGGVWRPFVDIGGAILVNSNTLTLSDLKMSADDDLKDVVRKLQIEKKMAEHQASRYRRMAEELYNLAKHKSRATK